MFFSVSAAAVCFIACHGGPADHFSTFAEDLVNKGYKVQIYATGPALKKFQDRNIEIVTPFALENISEEEAATELASSDWASRLEYAIKNFVPTEMESSDGGIPFFSRKKGHMMILLNSSFLACFPRGNGICG